MIPTVLSAIAATPLAASGGNTLILVAIILALGVTAQLLGDAFQVPSVLFLIIAGILVGPEVIGLVTFADLEPALRTIVGVSVAIIVFEGAFHLKLEKVREAPSAALLMVTLGAAISFVGTTVAVQFLLEPGWGIAATVGALLIATGPTVITPILSVVPVRDRVAAVLETEGIVNDVTAAILAVVIFELLASQETYPTDFLYEFLERLSVGLVVGIATALVIWYLLEHVDVGTGWTPQSARLMTLAGAVLAFAAADQISTEAGVAAVAAAGVLLGNLDLPFEEEIEEFKGDITLIVLSFVFIALAALIEFDVLVDIGIAGLLVVLVVTLVLRPLLVFLSTIGDRFTFQERLFISFVGPRGIIPASVATLFAIQLQDPTVAPTDVYGGEVLAGTVFLAILLTVVFQAGLARQIAEKLNVVPMRVLIIGGGRVGLALAERLEERGENIVLLEEDEEKIDQLRADGYTVRQGDGTDIEFLEASGAGNAKILVAATGDDDTNLLVAQLASSKFDVETVITRVNQPENVDAFRELEVETVDASMATAWAIDNSIERPALSNWMNELGRAGDVQEIEVTDRSLEGRTIRELDEELPNGCILALVSRGDENEIPDPDFEIECGDHLTVLGRTEDVRQALKILHPHD
ncbi:cation:proton antiporter [Salinarchaeum sp. Harcht-Bsk1]|uniref:cation:proton antiporter domain-containing protein n=1 Tax=Salinarchaeum sp. Harcht-Bsk1 TaxID=1333523 RepID=UPI0006777668